MKDTMSYLWEDVPRDLMARARAKAQAQRPPLAIKWLLLKLLQDWVGTEKKKPAAKTTPKKKTDRPDLGF